jgi:predicted  nucleic acid-binding Zn-ribbon protein
MTIDYDAGRFWLGVLNALGTAAVFAYTWFATRDKDNTKHIKAVEEAMNKAIAEYANRIGRIETQMSYVPTQQQLSVLQGEMRAVQTAQEAIQRDMLASRQSLNRIEDFLLNKK